MSEWISVEERLPKMNTLVLVCNPRSIRPTYGWKIGSNLWAINDEPDVSLCKIDRVSFVTHWMPLPEPPSNTPED